MIYSGSMCAGLIRRTQEHILGIKKMFDKCFLNLNILKSGWNCTPYINDPTGEEGKKLVKE